MFGTSSGGDAASAGGDLRRRTSRACVSILGAASAIAALVVAGGVEASAATFPGQNGMIAYTAVTGGGTDVFLVNPDGTGSTRLTYNTAGHSPHVTGSSSPSWSPDGTTIAYAGFDGTYRAIFTIPAAGGSPTQVTESTTGTVSSPSWSPDGSKIAYESGWEIYTIPATGGTPTNVTDNDTLDINPEWSPDGSTIAYAGRGHAGHTSDFDLFTIPAAGGVPTQLTDGPGSEDSPSWSPDGATIAYSGSGGGIRSGEIYTIPAQGGTPTNLTNNDIADARPSWSPDGTMIAYESEGGTPTNYSPNSFDIVTIPATGGERVNVTTTTKSEGSPAWGPSPSDVGTTDGIAPQTEMQTQPKFSVKAHQVVRWVGHDTGGSGVATFQVRRRTATWNEGFGTWTRPVKWRVVPSSQDAVEIFIAEGQTVCVSVRAVDHAGNVGAWAPQRCTTRPLDDRSLNASDGWSAVKGPAYYQRSASTTSASGLLLSKEGVLGRQVALVATTCPRCGTVDVSIDGKSIGTVDLHSTTRKYQQLKVLPRFPAQAGTVSIRSATTGRPIHIDGLAIAK